MEKKIQWESYHVEDGDEFIVSEEIEIGDQYEDDEFMRLEKPPQLYNTPFGWINLNQNLNPFAEHKLWKMYTTFDITASVKDTITSIAGVEVFTPITRYMCIIGIGKLFDSPQVRFNIQTALGVTNNSDDEIEKLQEELSEYDYWGIIYLPNGKYEYFKTNDYEDFEQNIATYEEASNISGGTCYSSERQE